MRDSIDPGQPLPVYIQLKALLLEQIMDGRYGAGDQLPTEHDLCARYGISRTPVHRALAELAEEGVIVRRRRHGSFVNPHWTGRAGSRAEVRVVVPDGPWEVLIREAAPPGIRLSIVSVPLADLHHVLQHAVAEGRAPDLAVLDSVWVAEFGAAGFLMPLGELDERWVRTEYEPDFLPPFIAANRLDGKPLAVQAEADVAGLWYRREHLAAAGAVPAETWDGLLRLGQRLASCPGGRPALVFPGGSRADETAAYCLLALLASNGATVLDDGGVTLDEPRTVSCLAFLRTLVDSGIVPVEVVSFDRERPIRMLAHGTAAMALGGSYDAPALAAAAGMRTDEVWRHFGFARIPAGPAGPARVLAGGMVYGIFRQAASPDLAMRTLREVVSTDSLTKMSLVTGQIASRRSAAERAAAHSPFLAATASMLDEAIMRPATPAYARVSAQLQAMLEGVLVGRLTPSDGARRTAELLAAITGLPLRADREEPTTTGA